MWKALEITARSRHAAAMRILLALAALAIALPAQAQVAPDPVRLKSTVDTLVGFGTRHTLSDTESSTRGIGAARRWALSELMKIGDACGGCIETANLGRTFTGPRAPNGVEVVNVLGFQKGKDAKRVVIVMAHIDSRVTDALNFTADAPGANDNASGVALVLETARILSKERFQATIIYAITSGEEQGLWGAQLLAETAREKGWDVLAVLNNDIVGNTIGQDGKRQNKHVRVFSEGIRAVETQPESLARRQDGGEDDGPSRALAKAIDGIAGTIPGGLDVFVDRRPDRFGRGGDHIPFLNLGYPAVRFSVAAENWDAQHQDLRTEGGRIYGDTADRMDFPYLAKVTAINVATIRRLANAPSAPARVILKGDLSFDTTVSWAAVPGAVKYRVYWRRNDGQNWTAHKDVTGTEIVLPSVPVDDNFIGVSAIAVDGSESLVTFGGRETVRR